MNVLIACGGTGGHLFPGIALAEELTKRGHTPYLVISEKSVDQEASKKYPQYTFITQPSRPKPKTTSIKMVGFLVSLLKTELLSKKLIKQKRIHAVIGMGGFTCFGPIFAGHALKILVFLHESNAIPGKSNIFLSKYAQRVFLGLAPAIEHFAPGLCEVVGTPLRNELKTLPSREEACSLFLINAEKPTVLIFGGSQGAQKLNSLICEAAQLGPDFIQYLHVTGTRDFERVSELSKDITNHFPIPFCADMPAAYATADLVVCRSGASSLAELSYLGLPSILVPYPHASDDHQTKNALTFTEHNAAILQQERSILPIDLEKLISGLIKDIEMREKLGQNIKKLSSDSAAKICDFVEHSLS